MSTESSNILLTIANETIQRCDGLLKHVLNINENSFITNLIEMTKEKLLAYQFELNEIRTNEAILDSRLAPNYAIKLGSIIASLHEIQDGPLTALLGFTKLDNRLNRLFVIALEEINYPYPTPVVSTSGRMHFACLQNWNLVFVPPIPDFLLTSFPDMFHELGHLIWKYNKYHLESLLLSDIDNYISSQMREAEIKMRGEVIGSDIRKLHFMWRDWIKELFSDILATFVTGTAYANSHLKYCIENIGSHFIPGKLGESFEHPSDSIRLNVISMTLMQIGLESDAMQISTKWQEFINNIGVIPPTEHDLLYPSEIIREIVSLSCEQIKSYGITDCKTNIDSSDSSVLMNQINEGWKKINELGSGYLEWEKSTLDALLSS